MVWYGMVWYGMAWYLVFSGHCSCNPRLWSHGVRGTVIPPERIHGHGMGNGHTNYIGKCAGDNLKTDSCRLTLKQTDTIPRVTHTDMVDRR